MNTSSARIAALALAIGLGASSAWADTAKDPVVAIVNGTEIKHSAVVEYQKSVPQLRQVPLEMVFGQLVDTMVNERLLTEAARKQKLQNDAKIQARLKEIEAKLMQQAYLTGRIDKEITEAALKKRYDAFVKDFKPVEEVKASHILVESEDEAKKIAADARGSGKFEDMAKEKSKDTGSAINGGDLGYFTQEEMVPEFAKAAFSTKPGTISDPVQTQFGWHVIKVMEKRPSKAPAFDEVKEQLQAEMAEQAVMKVLTDLRKGADIKTFAPDGSPMADKQSTKTQ